MIYYILVYFIALMRLLGGVGFINAMKKIDTVVLRETAYIAAGVILLSAVMEAVFLVGGWWDYTVLLGNLLGGIAAVLNFFLMGITVQKAVTKEEKEAKDIVKLSQTLRMFMQLAFAVIGFLFDVFNVIAVLIPLFFPRIAIMFRPMFDKKIGAEKEVEKTE